MRNNNPAGSKELSHCVQAREGGKGGKGRDTAKIEKTCGDRSFWGVKTGNDSI